VFDGDTQEAISRYRSMVSGESSGISVNKDAFESKSDYRLTKLEILDADGNQLDCAATGDTLRIRIHYHLEHPLSTPGFGLRFFSPDRQPLMRFVSDACGYPIESLPAGDGFIDCVIPRLPFTRSIVLIDADIGVRGSEFFHIVENAARLEVDAGDFYGSGVPFDSNRRHGFFVCEHKWAVGEITI
jgi:hypothetical protein